MDAPKSEVGSRATVEAMLDVGAFRLTVMGLKAPLVLFCLFNALGALATALLGHVALAAASFVLTTLTDFLFQRCVIAARLRRPSDQSPSAFLRLALWCAGRNLIVLAIPTAMAVSGGVAELAYFFTVAGLLMILAGGAGALSRELFWSYAAPSVVCMFVVVAGRIAGVPALGMAVGILTLLALLAMVSETMLKAVGTWHAAYISGRALIAELEVARDKAVAERAAADAAREEARCATRAKSAFLATMSHEIRTPMNGVLGMAELVRREAVDPVQVERLDVLLKSGEHLLSILNDILDVSKIDAGRLEIAPKPEALAPFLLQVVNFWSARADEGGIVLALEAAPELPTHVSMDAMRVRQILFNLIGNALKFTAGGRVTVRAEADRLGPAQIMLRLVVADTGPGIAPDDLARLFDRFAQGEGGDARRFGGAGLGLAICRQLTDLMGGQIRVESELGAGSRFVIELPLECVEPPAEAEAVEPATTARAVAPLQVLIVDDNDVNLLILNQLLNAFGHSVTKASSGAEALERLSERSFDLVLMDIQMPTMTGIEALQHLRERPGPNRAVPVIALTADVTSGGRDRYIEFGFTDHSAKPIQIPDLMSAIALAVGAAHASDPDKAAAA